ncbi:hypothetical protein C8J57DRAFT_1678888 [Mycena rebaudengoi]|nr:hypothetical protein C8J57DRAFT_1678888 [Mycena rebaudengoi]
MSSLIIFILCLISFFGGKAYSLVRDGISVSAPVKIETIAFIPALQAVFVLVGMLLILNLVLVAVLRYYLKAPNITDGVTDLSDEATLVCDSVLKIRVDKLENLVVNAPRVALLRSLSAPAEPTTLLPATPPRSPQAKDRSLVIYRGSPPRPNPSASRPRPTIQEQQQQQQASRLNILRQATVSVFLWHSGRTVVVEEEACFASIVDVEEDEELEDPPMVNIEECGNVEPERSRPSHLNFLYRVAASVMLRKMQEAQIEECFATIEEVEGEEEEKPNAPRSDLVTQPDIFPALDSPSPSEPDENTEEPVTPVVKAITSDDPFNCPSYEEFALGAPAEPLFQKRVFDFEALPDRLPSPLWRLGSARRPLPLGPPASLSSPGWQPATPRPLLKSLVCTSFPVSSTTVFSVAPTLVAHIHQSRIQKDRYLNMPTDRGRLDLRHVSLPQQQEQHPQEVMTAHAPLS